MQKKHNYALSYKCLECNATLKLQRRTCTYGYYSCECGCEYARRYGDNESLVPMSEFSTRPMGRPKKELSADEIAKRIDIRRAKDRARKSNSAKPYKPRVKKEKEDKPKKKPKQGVSKKVSRIDLPNTPEMKKARELRSKLEDLREERSQSWRNDPLFF